MLADWLEFRHAEGWIGTGLGVREAFPVDNLCSVMSTERMGTFPSHTGCSKGPKSCGFVEILIAA